MPDFVPEMLFIVLIGFAAGLVIYFVRHFIERKKTKTLKLEAWKIGRKVPYFLDEEFLRNLEPGKISMEAIKSEYGEPHELIKQPGYVIYSYIFKNAMVYFGASSERKMMHWVTVNSIDEKHSIRCPLSPASENDLSMLGEATIDIRLTNSAINSNTAVINDKNYSALQVKFPNHPVKHLTYTYIVFDKIIQAEHFEEFIDLRIDQVCITANGNFYSVIPPLT